MTKELEKKVNAAIKQKWATKKRNYKKIFSPCHLIADCHFYVKGYSYEVYANTYTLSKSVARVISDGTNSW